MLNKLKSLFKKNAFTGTKHIIKPAFVCGGVQYYEFDNTANLPYKRGLKFLSIYNELDMRCDRFYLEKHVEAIEAELSKSVGVQQIFKVKQLNDQLKERLKMIYHEDLVYKVASIVFFDENENPDDWEWQYALKKIAHWKKHEDVAAFFLHEPIQRLIPFLNTSAVNTRLYSEAQKAADQIQLENILASLSLSPKTDLPTFIERYYSQEMKQNSK
jgi:hypothetical protein